MTDAQKTAAAKPKPAEKREYIVFGEVVKIEIEKPLEPSWVEIGRATTATRDEALERIVDALPADEQSGPFVAVAARHWKPTAPVVETVVKRTWT